MIIGLYRVLFEALIASEVPSILAEHPFIEIFKGWFPINAIVNDAGPVIATTVAGGTLGESFGFAGRVALVVPVLATAALLFVLEVALEHLVKRAEST